jgi:hypothetical protein
LKVAEPILVEVSPGELFDKITVLRVKNARFADERKLGNIRVELDVLEETARRCVPHVMGLQAHVGRLECVNAALFDTINRIYDCERDRAFGPLFVDLARSVYTLNDQRAAIKREINLLFGSRLVEEKGHDLPVVESLVAELDGVTDGWPS